MRYATTRHGDRLMPPLQCTKTAPRWRCWWIKSHAGSKKGDIELTPSSCRTSKKHHKTSQTYIHLVTHELAALCMFRIYPPVPGFTPRTCRNKVAQRLATVLYRDMVVDHSWCTSSLRANRADGYNARTLQLHVICCSLPRTDMWESCRTSTTDTIGICEVKLNTLAAWRWSKLF